MKKIFILVFALVIVSLNLLAFGQQEVKAKTGHSISNPDKNQLTEEEKISQLINYVRHLDGATFIRNGKEYTPDKAADHLQSKFEKHKKRVKTAHDFVNNLASYSATKEDYQIRLRDGHTVKCGELLKKELEKLENPS